jgi:hypothetical protein
MKGGHGDLEGISRSRIPALEESRIVVDNRRPCRGSHDLEKLTTCVLADAIATAAGVDGGDRARELPTRVTTKN